MNKDQLEGTVKTAAGKVQKQVGKLTGSEEQELKGHVKVVKGKAQQAVGDAKKLVQDLKRKP